MGTFLLGLDLGTTHCKAGLFGQDGRLVKVSSRRSQARRLPSGEAFYDPQEVWKTAAAALREAIDGVPPEEIDGVGIASMAESGLLVDRATGAPRTGMVPWFDPAATPQAELLLRAGDPVERFCRTGIRPNFKCSLAKLLRLREQDPASLAGAVWLNAADYLAFRLAGTMATDPSLAVRTYAFDLGRKDWDADWLTTLQIPPAIFAQLRASGQPVGEVHREAAAGTGLREGTPVAVCGHDHVCAAYAAGAVDPGLVFDSMGTAEALVGAFPARPLGEGDYRSGLAYGPHVVRGLHYWMGGLSASGGSVEWLRGILGEPALSYGELESLLAGAGSEPTGILYFPYLSGSGSPHADLRVRAAFVGLKAGHGREALVKAVFEGTAFEVEFIRRRAEEVLGTPIQKLAVSGGGTRNRGWMQIKADVSGCAIEILEMPEATLLGAALLAGVGVGVFSGAAEALAGIARPAVEVYLPEEGRHRIYRELYKSGFLALQEPLRGVGVK
jgi:xylulokinase